MVLLAAEDDADFNDSGVPKEESWDDDTHVFVEVKIDGGSYVKVLQFAAGADGSSDNNMEPKLDTNLDGEGDGRVITDTFQEFEVNLSSFTGLNIPSSASTLDLKITFENLTAGGEDFAIDNIRIVQNYVVPVAPVISGGATASIDVAENTTAVTTVVATDANGDTISYDIDDSSSDASKFAITTKTDGTGADLAFINAPDFENPASSVSPSSNVYMVVIRVNSGTGTALCCNTQAITVTVTDVDDTTMSVDENTITSSVQIYPNPSGDFLLLSNVTETEKYSIYNISGKEVLKGTISDTEKIDIKNLVSGLYFLKLNNTKTLKFLKK